MRLSFATYAGVGERFRQLLFGAVLEAAVAYFHAALNAIVQLEALLGDRPSATIRFHRGVVMLATARALADGAVIEHGARCRSSSRTE
jgi:hypothetical protein